MRASSFELRKKVPHVGTSRMRELRKEGSLQKQTCGIDVNFVSFRLHAQRDAVYFWKRQVLDINDGANHHTVEFVHS